MRAIGSVAARWWVVVACVLAWQAFGSTGHLNPLVVPSPSDIVKELARHPGTFATPLLRTVSTALIGLCAGLTIGVIGASITWMLPMVRSMVTPVALVIRSVPFVALIPVLTRLLGYTEHAAWIICALVSFFPAFVLVSSGLQEIPPNGWDVFEAAGASRWDRFRRLALPASLPACATALRIAAASSMAAALVAEFLMGVPGLALVLTQSLNALDITELWAASACAVIVAIAAYLGASRVEEIVKDRYT